MKFKKMLDDKVISREKVMESLQGWIAYAEHGDTYRLRRKIMKYLVKMFKCDENVIKKICKL